MYIRSATQLYFHQDTDRIVEMFAQIDDRCVEYRQLDRKKRHFGKDGGHDSRIDYRIEHAAALIYQDDDMPGIVTTYVLVEIQAVGDNCPVFAAVVFQILFDGLLEIEVPEYFVAGIGMRKFLSVEGFAYIYFQLLLNLFYDLFHD